MDKQLWVTRYHPTKRFPEGKYPNRSIHDTGLGQYVKMTSRWTTMMTCMDHHRYHHVARARVADYADRVGACAAEAWNFFDETPTLGEKKQYARHGLSDGAVFTYPRSMHMSGQQDRYTLFSTSFRHIFIADAPVRGVPLILGYVAR